MGATVTKIDYDWCYTDEPHASRRKEILAKYPQIKTLMKPDYTLVTCSILVMLLNIIIAVIMRNADWIPLIIVTYTISGTINHSLALANHELAHNLGFGNVYPIKNRLLGILVTLPMGVPSSVAFKKYHMDHHRYQGADDVDVDIPLPIEGRIFSTTFGKFIWLSMQPFFYAIRPLVMLPKAVSPLEILNAVACITFDATFFYFFGAKTLFYFIGGSLMGLAIHPISGHFIAEHYTFTKGIETYSYYGPLNFFAWNVGYHNEHHDFPSVPGKNLPQISKIAPEFYTSLPCYNSWVKVLYMYVTDPEIGPFSRIKRPIDLKSAKLE